MDGGDSNSWASLLLLYVLPPSPLLGIVGGLIVIGAILSVVRGFSIAEQARDRDR